MRARLAVDGSIVGMRGWGMVAPNWPVRVELRDPGVLAVVRLGHRSSRDAFVLDITELALSANARQLSRGGRYVGGGFGVRGMITGMAMAKAMNAMSYQRWEETRLHLIEHLAVGTRRSITVRVPAHTPTSLVELMGPALADWADAWVQATLEDRLRPFVDAQHLPSVYAQVDAIHERLLITPEQALALCSHHTQSLLAALHTRLLAGEVTHPEAEDISAELGQLLAEHRITHQQARPLQGLLAQIPTPAVQTDRDQARDQLIAELRKLRATGAITESELQAELARLHRP